MHYSVFENSIIIEEAGLMCDSTGDACWELSVCVFFHGAHISECLHAS